MARKKTSTIVDNKDVSIDKKSKEEVLLKTQDEINKELLKEKKEKEKKKRSNVTYLFIHAFICKLKEDKLYLFSFVVTLVFLGLFSFHKLQETEGYYDKRKEPSASENNVTPTVDTDLNKNGDSSVSSEELDVSDYVGIYSREVVMSSPVVLSDTCSISSYKIVYQIKKDKTITKYLINDCVGTLKIWSDSLSYVSNGGARYISSHSINYLFSATSMKEVDGETYKIDDEISSIKVNQKIKNVDISFYDTAIVFMTKDDLLLVKGNTISYRLKDQFVNKGGDLEQMVYKSATKNVFKFIVFSNDEEKVCYSSDEIADEKFDEETSYKIYSIKYNSTSGTFDEAKEIASRMKSAGCDVYTEDLELLKE